MSRSKGSQKKPKDPNAPKKHQSSYFIFSNERRKTIQSSKPGQSVTEISKIISREWKEMDQSQRKHYDDLAAAEKVKYTEAMEVYTKTDSYKQHQKKLEEWKEREKAMGRIGGSKSGGSGSKGGHSGSGKGGKGKPPRKPKQPDLMPKRPQTSYFIFSNERRNELKQQYPDKKITELSKLIADEWKLKTAEEKKEYELRAQQNKQQYVKEMDEYKKTEEYKDFQTELELFKKEKKRWDTMDVDEDEDTVKVSMPRKPKDDQCPKRPLSSYFLFAQEKREKTKQEHPNKAITEIAKEISNKWKELTEEEKKPYNDEAARLKKEYKRKMDEYEGSDAQKEYKLRLEEWKKECNERQRKAQIKADKKKAASKSPTKKVSKSTKGKSSKGGKGNKGKNKMKDDDESESESESGSDNESSSGSSSGSGSESNDDNSSSSGDGESESESSSVSD